MQNSSNKVFKLVLAAVFLALAMVLPFLTGQIPTVGNMLCPMHIPVLLCGFFCGPVFGLAIGFIAPFLRMLIFGMPPMMTAIAMSAELAAYGFFSGFFYRILPKKKVNIYVSLILAMIIGRIIWGIVKAVIAGIGDTQFGITIFLTEGFVNALPGIVVQIVLIPILVMTLGSLTVHTHTHVHEHTHDGETHTHEHTHMHAHLHGDVEHTHSDGENISTHDHEHKKD